MIDSRHKNDDKPHDIETPGDSQPDMERRNAVKKLGVFAGVTSASMVSLLLSRNATAASVNGEQA